MLIYIIFLLICLICSSAKWKNSIHQNKISTFLLGFLLLCIALFRDYTVGNDVLQYCSHYLDSTNDPKDINTDMYEYGYRYLLAFCRLLNIELRHYFFLVNIIIFIPIILYVKKYSLNVAYSLFLYVTIGSFEFNFTGLRQSMSIGIILTALLWTSKMSNQFKKTLFLILGIYIASTIHYSAQFCYIIPIILLFRRIRVTYTKWLLLVPFIVLFLGNIIMLIVENLIVIRYSSYLDEDISNKNWIYYFAIPYSFLLFITYLLNKRTKTEYITDKATLFGYLSTLLYNILAFTSNTLPMLNRLSTYFHLFVIIFISNEITNITNVRLKRISYIGITLLCLIYFLVTIPNTSIANYKLYF